MIDQPWLQWVLTFVFALSGLVMALHARSDVLPLPRTSHTLHTVMGAAMVVMVWPWGMQVLVTPQIVLFGLATVWFAGLVLLRLTGRAPSEAGGLTSLLLHAAMMGSMLWMVVVMGRGDSMTAAMSHAGMTGMTGMAGSAGTSDSMGQGLAGIARTSGFLLLAVLVIGALIYAGRAFRASMSSRRADSVHATTEAVAMATMCGGMAAMTALMF